MHWRTNHINSAVIACLEHVATSTAPPGAGAADFLLRLLDEKVFAIEEVDEIATKVSIIINGIVERGQLSRPMTGTVPADELGLSATR